MRNLIYNLLESFGRIGCRVGLSTLKLRKFIQLVFMYTSKKIQKDKIFFVA